MDVCHRADIKSVALLVLLGAAGVTGEVEGHSTLRESGVYLWAVVSVCFVLALAVLVINCAKTNKKKHKNEGTIDAEENDPYIDPETWTADGPTDQPIMGQQHSTKKNKKNKRQSGASSELSSVTANHNHNQAVPITNYNQNISGHQPTITSAKDQEMDDLPHKVVDHRMNGWTTFVPTTDGSSHVPSEESSRRSSIANTVDEDADLKRLSQWSQSAAPRIAAPVPVTTAAPVPVTNAPAPVRTTAAPRTKAPAPVPVAAVPRTTAPIPVIIEEHIPDLPPKTHKINETATPRSSLRSSKSKASSTKSKSSAASSSLSAYSDSNNNRKSAAEENQDKTLVELGLYRYKIIGDGNCLFRAVASQLRVPQARFHLLLRKAAAMWMKEHKDELMDQGLLENDDELWATEQEGQWPGHAAIVALANLLKVNIAVIQGGEKGEIDIEHIEPAEGHVDDGDEHGSLILSYMFNGHYDAVVDTPDMDNPEYTAWCQRRGADDFASETLARKLQAEEDAKAKRMSEAEYDDFRLARALAEEERQAAMEERERLVAMQAQQAGANGVKLALLEHRASAHVGVNQTVTGYDTIDETRINNKKKNVETTSNASSEYEKLTELSTPVKPSEEGERKHPVFGRQRSLSLTPAATGSSMKMSLSPQKMFSRTRSQSLSESQHEKSLKEYTEDDIKKFLKPLSTIQARKKFAYLDLIV